MSRATAAARRWLGRSDGPRRTTYLISTAGHPNYGDELITRAWLDYLALQRPDDDVWLDCPHPGRASHLFADTHPRLRVTSTAWELAMSSETHDPISDEARIAQIVTHLGSPRVDPGILKLREAGSIHVLGGGYLNALWQDNLGLLSVVHAAAAVSGARTVATGAGLQPLSPPWDAWVADKLAGFDHVETRDRQSADLVGGDVGLDDAFLAVDTAMARSVWRADGGPKRVVLVQGDLRAWSDDDAVTTISTFLDDTSRDDIAFVEAIPPEDGRYPRMLAPEARFYPFGEIWESGLPARAGQEWLTSRFHAHLIAAAAGAAGTVIAGQAGYYDVKHRSLLALGTGWTLVEAGADLTSEQARPACNPDFPERARAFGAQKRRAADRIYPR